MRWITKHCYSPYVPWRLLGGLFLSVILIVAYYLLGPASTSTQGRPERSAYVLAVVSTLYSLFLALLCFKGSRPRRKASDSALAARWRGLHFSPILLGLGIIGFACGHIIWLCEMLITQRVGGYPAPENYLQLIIMYPCFMGAILLLPTRNLSQLSRLRIFLDGSLIMAAVATLGYYFLVAPLMIKGNGTFLAKLMSGIYLDADLILMFCLLLVVLRSGERELRPVLVLFGLAIVTLLITHELHLYEVLYKGYNTFSKSNIGWPISGVFLVGAAQTINTILNRDEKRIPRSPESVEQVRIATFSGSWRIVLPSLMALIFCLFIFMILLRRNNELFPGQMTIIYIGGFSVLILTVLRQLLTLYQVSTLQRQLQVKNRSLSMLNTHLEQRAAMDALTGLPNHRKVVEELDKALEHARTTGSSCAVVFMDVDSFKTINDRYGHLTGDTVLCNFATLVKSGLRVGDWVGRWGGEEFVAILPDTDPLEALNLAEGIRKRIERHVLAGNGEINVTCSLGVASYPQDGSEREDLIMGADNAMYAAKRLGRNQTRAAHEPLVQAMSALEPTPATVEKEEMLVVVDAFLALLEARDPGTSQHVRRVATLALKLALALGLSGSEAHLVSLGGLLHDLGKIAVPDAILGKHAQLDKAERAAMLQHPLTGAAILQPIPVLRDVAPIVRAHHEQMDGSGYPDGLQGEEIPLGARIVAVADAYDAMTNERVYHSALPSAEALRILRMGAGSQFDPRVVETLAQLLVTSPSLSGVA